MRVKGHIHDLVQRTPARPYGPLSVESGTSDENDSADS